MFSFAYKTVHTRRKNPLRNDLTHLDVLPQQRGCGKHLVAFETGYSAFHVCVAKVFLQRASNLESGSADGALPGHKILVGIHVYQEICLASDHFRARQTLVLSVHLIFLEQLLDL